MKTPRRHTDRNKGRHRLNTGGPSSSILSEAFRVIRYQKYRVGVVRAHSGSEGTWLWTCLLDRMTPPLFFIPPLPPLPFPSPHFFFLPQSSSSLSLLAPFSSSKFPPTSLFPPSHLSLPPHQSHWRSPVRDISPMGQDTGRTDSSRRGSRQ